MFSNQTEYEAYHSREKIKERAAKLKLDAETVLNEAWTLNAAGDEYGARNRLLDGGLDLTAAANWMAMWNSRL